MPKGERGAGEETDRVSFLEAVGTAEVAPQLLDFEEAAWSRRQHPAKGAVGGEPSAAGSSGPRAVGAEQT